MLSDQLVVSTIIPLHNNLQQLTRDFLCEATFHGGNGNCEAQDKTALLSCFGDTISTNENNVSIANKTLIRRYNLHDQQQQSDYDYIMPATVHVLSEFKEEAMFQNQPLCQ